MATLSFKVGRGEHEFALIEVVGDRGDGWLPARVTVKAGGFSGQYTCDLDGGAFSRFASELRELHRTLKGTASFTSYEKQIELSLVGDGLATVLKVKLIVPVRRDGRHPTLPGRAASR